MKCYTQYNILKINYLWHSMLLMKRSYIFEHSIQRRSKCYHIHSNYDLAYNISGAIFKNVMMISDTSEDILNSNNICNDLLDFILFIKENFDKFRCK